MKAALLVRWAVAVTLVMMSVVQAASPLVSNVRASQRSGTKIVDIYYNVSDADSDCLAVSLAVSTNDGASYNLPATSFSSGNPSVVSVGGNVAPGNNRWVVWNAGTDWNGQFSSKVKFRVTADDFCANRIPEAVESFCYDEIAPLPGLYGPAGWGGAWYGDVNAQIVDFQFLDWANYPSSNCRKLKLPFTSTDDKAVFRPLSKTYTSGRIYFGYIMNYTYAVNTANSFVGLSLFWSNTSEKVFFGEIWGTNATLGIDNSPSSPVFTLANGVSRDYIITGYYDWDSGVAKAKGYRIGYDPVPLKEPTQWDVTISKSPANVGWVNTIRIAAGGGSAGDSCYFDEVRIATNWAGLFGGIENVAPHYIASDTAANTTYASGWEAGMNGGFGWQPWSFGGFGNSKGAFIARSDHPNLDCAENAWGLWCNDGSLANAFRDCEVPMQTGDILTFHFENNWVSAGGFGDPWSVGFGMQTSNGNWQFEFMFIGGDTHYIINDAVMSRRTAIPYTDQGLTVVFEMTSPTSYRMTVNSSEITGTLRQIDDGKIRRFRVWNFGAGLGPNYDVFLTDMHIMRK